MDGLLILVRQSSHPVVGRLKGGRELGVGTILSSRHDAKVVVAVGGNTSSVHWTVDSSLYILEVGPLLRNLNSM